MGEQEAKIVFSETGSESVINGFKNVGAEAGKASTNIGSAGNAIKDVGGGMKNAASNIGNVVTAFATLTLSVVGTWRAYRDLGDAQLGVDKANFKVQKSTQAVANATKLVQGLKAGMRRTDLESVAATSKIISREEALKKKLKDGSITRKAAKAEQDAINLARSKVGSDKASELAKAEQDLKNKTEQLGFAQESATQKQKHFNDATQDFYLSLLPTALSTVGTVVSGFESLKNVIGGGGTGLIGSLSGIGLILGGASIALLAYQNNWLGFKDIVGGVIDWVKERFGVWKDTIAAVFNLIKSGDWNGAFDLIKTAAIKFWEDVKKAVPFFGGVENLINLFREGKWSEAFNVIRDAAVFFWVELKKAIPLFGTIENVIAGIRAGDWEGVFTEIGEAIKKGLAAIFGGDIAEKIILKFQLMKISAITEMNLMKDSLTKKGGPIDLIQQGLAKLGSGDIVGGFQQIWTGFDKAVGIFITRANDWIKLNFGIDLVALGQQALAIGNTILTKIQEGMTFISTTWIDPILVALLDPVTWINGFITMGGFFVKIGTALYTAIGTALGNVAKDPKGTAAWWNQIGEGIWKGITDWFTINLPGAKKALEAMAQSFVDAFESTKVWFTNIGIEIWNNIIDGLKSAVPVDFNDAVKGWLESLKGKPIEVPAKVVIQGDASTQLGGKGGIPVFKAELQPKIDQPKLQAEANNIISKIKPPQLKLDADPKQADQKTDQFKNRVERGKYIAKISADTKQADNALKSMLNKINSSKATIKVATQYLGSPLGRQILSGNLKIAQGGMHQTLSRDTLIQAHKGEQVDIDQPAKQARKAGGNGNGVNVRVFIGDTELKQLIHYTVNEDQGISK